ncbi:MAG: hypothetical protein KAZ71_06750 [Bacteroidia bacterium]|nr:hypothetical protein [Bacteroidia bacterium]
MKSINFQRNKSLIRVVNEQQKVKKTKQRNWDRILYVGLLGLFVLFMGYYFFSKYVYVHAYGHVIIENTHIRLTDDARIIEFYVHEGDSLQKNDTLFSYALDRDEDINGQSSQALSIGSITGASKDDWWVKELFALKKKITLNNIDVSENGSLIANYKSEIKRLSNEVILDVLPKSRLEFVQNEIFRLNTENQKLQRENNELYGLIKTLGPTTNKNKYSASNIRLKTASGSQLSDLSKLSFSEELLSEPKYFKSPISGVSTRIFIHDYETVLKSEEIMSIHQAHPAFIKAYFDQEDLRYFNVGDVFNIDFPDGTSSKGILKRFYIATYTLPEEFQKKYEPTTRSIAADIYPLDSTEIVKWRAFYKMSVDISKLKFN